MSTVWFSVSEPRVYYRIPDDFSWSDSGVMLTNFDLQMKSATAAALAGLEIGKAEAFGGTSVESKPAPTSINTEADIQKEAQKKTSKSKKIEDMGVFGVLGVLKGVVDEGLSIGEELLGQLDKEEAIALAKEVVDEAMEVVSELVDSDSVSEDDGSEKESLTGLHLRSLFRQGLKDFRFSVQPREKGGAGDSEG